MLDSDGSFHVPKEIRWHDHFHDKNLPVYVYLSELAPDLNAFSIVQAFDEDLRVYVFYKDVWPNRWLSGL
jgi:hypothetical protein